MGHAAFFDLDRTLLSGASAHVVSRVLRETGVVSRNIPGESLMYQVFETFGENLPSMVLGRQAVIAMRGHSREEVRAASRTAAPDILAMVQPYANQVIEGHRAEGRKVVLATTTPRDLIEPFAELMGFDDVIATTYAVDADGCYTGELDGQYVWSRGKRDAVKRWADEHGVDLAGSYAYSDSVFDEPLLASVGNPFCVNPDWRLRLMAAARRWPVMHLDVPLGVAKVPVVGLEAQQVLMKFARPEVFPYARFKISGTENIPTDGAAIICGNHRSYFDIAAVSLAVAKTGRAVRFLGKKEVFDAPVIGPLAAALGGIRVERGTGSDEPLRAATESLVAGDLVALMPQGTIPRGRAFFDPVLKGRWGAAKLAAQTKAPVIPIGIWGTEKVWPRNAKLPNITNVTSPPDVIIVVGAPVPLSYTDADADTAAIMAAISALLPPEGREYYEPTEDELRRSYPSNYKGDPNAEDDRRPGTD
ncbi:MAG: HAD-IB family hydrolase [Actinobacteria bacterium]|nr:HAD-IB family hydrolase [Actinomycetota bacterium]